MASYRETALTVEDPLDSFRHVPPWVFCLGGGKSDDFGTQVRESRLDENRPEREETTPRARNAVELDERTRVLPVSETDAIVVRALFDRASKSQRP